MYGSRKFTTLLVAQMKARGFFGECSGARNGTSWARVVVSMASRLPFHTHCTALKNGQILDNANGIPGIEFMAVAQAPDFREFTPGKDSLKAREVIRKFVDHLEVDRPLYNDHNAMKRLVKSGEILEEVERW